MHFAGQQGQSLLLKSLENPPSRDPNTDEINKVATCIASKIPSDSLHPLPVHNRPAGGQGTGVKLEPDQIIKPDPDIKTEIKEEPMDNSGEHSNNATTNNATSGSNSGGPSSLDIKPNMIKTEPPKDIIKKEDLKPDVKPAMDSKAAKVTFTREDLKNALEPPLMKMYNCEPEAAPFRIPVDPTALQIPDYFDIIKNPMDMSQIKTKLDNGEYKDPWEFVDDVWLMFENAWTYNRKTSRVYKYCSKVLITTNFLDDLY